MRSDVSRDRSTFVVRRSSFYVRRSTFSRRRGGRGRAATSLRCAGVSIRAAFPWPRALVWSGGAASGGGRRGAGGGELEQRAEPGPRGFAVRRRGAVFAAVDKQHLVHAHAGAGQRRQ